jgi:hypothetical protein
MRMVLATRPCRTAFWEEIDLPSGVFGPRDFFPLALDALMRACELIRHEYGVGGTENAASGR